MNLFESQKVFLTKIGNAFVISIRRFDPATGEEADVEIHAVDVEMLEKIKLSANEIVQNVDYVISEIAKIK